MNEINVLQLAGRIQREYDVDSRDASNQALQIKEECPLVLVPNVCEWAKGESLSDIYVGHYSLPMILYIWNNQDFLRALGVMIELLEGEASKAELKIWEMRR